MSGAGQRPGCMRTGAGPGRLATLTLRTSRRCFHGDACEPVDHLCGQPFPEVLSK